MLHRTREQLLRERTRIVNQVKMRLYQFGVAVPRTANSKSLEELLKSRGLSQELRLALEALIGLWGALKKEIKKIEEHQKAQAKQDPCTEVYTSLPGIGFQGARVLSNEVGTLEQFPNERAF